MNIASERLLENVRTRLDGNHWGALLERTASGARCARTTAPAAGTTGILPMARTTAPTLGGNASPAYRMTPKLVVCRWRVNGSGFDFKGRLSALTTPRAIMPKTSRNQLLLSDALRPNFVFEDATQIQQHAFHYEDLVAENVRRGTDVPEYGSCLIPVVCRGSLLRGFVELRAGEKPGDI